jgi:putative acetyltransferase
MIKFTRTDYTDKNFQQLVQLLDADLSFRDGSEHDFYAQFNKIMNIQHVIVAYESDRAIGCGAFKPFNEGSVEIKRMFVRPEFRGKGIGLEILRELEIWAHESGFDACILETGKKQPEAIQLYTKAGYQVIENFGQYAGVDNSVCMRKPIR